MPERRETVMAKARIGLATAVLAGTAVLLSACGESSPAPVATPSAAASASASVASESASPEASPVVMTEQEVTGEVSVPKGGYFLFPIPPSMVTGSGAEAWQWTMDYDKSRLIESSEVGAVPSDADIAIGDSGKGQVWQARDVDGETTITYSYVDPDEPTVKVNGTFNVTVVP